MLRRLCRVLNYHAYEEFSPTGTGVRRWWYFQNDNDDNVRWDSSWCTMCTGWTLVTSHTRTRPESGPPRFESGGVPWSGRIILTSLFDVTGVMASRANYPKMVLYLFLFQAGKFIVFSLLIITTFMGKIQQVDAHHHESLPDKLGSCWPLIPFSSEVVNHGNMKFSCIYSVCIYSVCNNYMLTCYHCSLRIGMSHCHVGLFEGKW